ncbi:hypothetical protein E2C01_012362 [Portunus trituberculatus]|uniref:Uncharacterized protein n=1 Tax=Portunus trituberculatus TaxID=210409 RepID=A0A5B7DDS3_PORTR|nr:hypothetical protein [Portunus trituberculatus]
MAAQLCVFSGVLGLRFKWFSGSLVQWSTAWVAVRRSSTPYGNTSEAKVHVPSYPPCTLMELPNLVLKRNNLEF